MDTKSESSHTADNISRKVKKHVPGKPIGRMGNHSSLCRQCAPLMISKRFAVALSENDVQNSRWLSLRSTTNRMRSIGSQFNNFCFNM